MPLLTRPRHKGLAVLLLFLFLIISLYFLSSTYETRVSAALGHLASWNLPEAEESFGSIVTDYPDSIEARRWYATCLLRRGELRKALREAVRLEVQGSSPRLSDMLLLSTIHFYLGRYDTSGLMAEQAMRQALPLRDSSALSLA
jgi:hypothetical protein